MSTVLKIEQRIFFATADLKGWKLGRALFVAEAGMNSEGIRQSLARACGKYL
jgi:hypothetical protein